MMQTKLSKNDSPLLDSAISRLRPGVFSHPVWVRFGNKNESAPTGTIKNLFIEAENLKYNNPSDACQVLLICAVYQNYFGQAAGALATILQAQSLAEKAGLSQEYLWALWGASAVCVQHRDFEEAARHLESLKQVLDQQNEWVLANYVDTVRRALQEPAAEKMTEQNSSADHQPVENLLGLTFRWLNLWGFSVQTFGPDLQPSAAKASPRGATRPLFSVQRWQGRWSSIRLMFEGEIKFNRLDVRARVGSKRKSLWKSISGLFRSEQATPGRDALVVDIEKDSSENTASTLPGEHLPAEIPIPENLLSPATEQIEDTDTQIVVQSSSEMPVSVYMLGFFRMTIQEASIKLPSSRSLLLLKYLLLKHSQHIPREILMDIFWPDVEPEKARNNLNVTIYHIRKALRQHTDITLIRYADNAYGIAPEVRVWLDVDEFEQLVKRGKQLETGKQLSEAVSNYEAAISLYQGDFLDENPYEGWTALTRERLRMAYLDMLDRLNQIYYNQNQYAMCITLSQLILTRDRCREDAHYMLMRCYSHQGQAHLALRQYQVCQEALWLELEVAPSPATTQLFERIRQHKGI